MDESNKSQKLKLKKISLKTLLIKNKLRTESSNIKTEHPNIKTRNILYSLNNKNLYLNTLNATGLPKNDKTIINLKYKTPHRKNNFQDLNKIIFTNREIKLRNKISIDLNGGYTNYLKEKTNKIYRRKKLLLFEQKIKKLSLPKYKHITNFENKKASNSISTRHNYSNKKDDYYQLSQNYKYKKNLNYKIIFEREKIKERKRYNEMLLTNFKKLDSCESKFNSVIDKTLKLLSEYQHSFGYIKNEK